MLLCFFHVRCLIDENSNRKLKIKGTFCSDTCFPKTQRFFVLFFFLPKIQGKGFLEENAVQALLGGRAGRDSILSR